MEIVVRAAVMFFVLFVLVRASGKRELAQMSAFELVLLMVLGDVVQQAITQEDMSMTGGTIAAATLTLLVVLLGVVTYRFPKVRTVVEGVPVIVIRRGEVIEAALRIERLTADELVAEARQHGIVDLATVDLCVLETDGRFSFIVDDASTPPDPPADPRPL
jgi:uncharacterized membrane protein YcaP (DUF421 family)